MAANAWIMAGYTDEADTGINFVLSSEGTWLDVATTPSLINGAAVYLDGTLEVDEVRAIQGRFQQRYTDRDVRMERATVTVAFPAV